MNWRHRAACRPGRPLPTVRGRRVGPELFFALSPDRTAAAKTVCAGCEVREQCLAYAVSTGQDTGVWGGLTDTERRALRRRDRGRLTSTAAPSVERAEDRP